MGHVGQIIGVIAAETGEVYLEGAENDYGDKASARGHDLREEIKINKRNGAQWHHDLFDQYYTHCWAKVKAVDLHKAPFNFGHDCFHGKFVELRENHYRSTSNNDY